MFRSTLLYLGIFTIFVSIFSLLNILFCYYFDTLLNIQVYFACLLVFLFLGVTFIFFNKKFLNVKLNFFEKLFLVIAGFFYFPLLISMPYYLSIYDISFINSYFEAISGFTSTGFTIFENVKKIDEPLLIWRSGSQWLGGLYFLYSLFLLAESPKIKIKNIYTNYEGLNLSEIKNQYTKVLLIYFLLTALVFILLTYSGIRLFEGFNLSMTITSAGGFIPTNYLSEIVSSENKKLIFSFSMLIPFFNLYLIYNVIFGDRSLINNKEDLYLLILLLFVLITTYIFFSNIFGFSSIFFAVLSSLSNIGLGLDNQFSNLSFLFLILAIIGGSSFSTSSGLKFIKLYTLFKFSLKEIYLLVKPLYVSSNILFLSKNKIKDEEINIYFLSIVFFIFTLFILSGILSLEQINFKDSLTLSILTITNTVNSNNYNLSEFYFLDINIISKISLMLFMVIGRVELLGFLILIKKFFFK
jgi:trk system potassium uptake protein TrkH